MEYWNDGRLEYWKIGMPARLGFMAGLPAVGWRNGMMERNNIGNPVTLYSRFAPMGVPFMSDWREGAVLFAAY